MSSPNSTDEQIDPDPDSLERTVDHREVLSKLGREYADRLPGELVLAAVLHAEESLQPARITTYLPVLVERHARNELRAHERSRAS